MDSKDFEILAALHEDARQSYRSIGHQVSLTAPAVRERLSRLKRSSILRGYGLWIDPCVFGREEVVMFFRGERSRQEFLGILRATDVARAVWKLEGGVTVVVWTRDPTRAIQQVSTFLRESPTRHALTERRFLGPLTVLDWEIIDALVDDPVLPFKRLVESTRLSPKTIRRHLRTLLQSKAILVSPLLGAVEGSGELVYTLAVDGKVPMSELRKILGGATLIHQTHDPPMKMLLCRSRDLSEMTTMTMDLRKLSGVNSATVSLNREVLFANKFIHSLVREKILALQKTRTPHSEGWGTPLAGSSTT